jgi:aryl-alcohol dehydrogenase-like predicted oxidoreductase
MEGLLALKEAGKIRHIGVSNFSADQHREAAQYGRISSSQPRYNMFWRHPEADVLPTCLELGIGVIAHSPLAKGMLTGKYRPGHRFDSGDERSEKPEFKPAVFNRAMPIVEQLVAWAADHGRTGGDLAVAWTLAHPSMASCIVGAKTPEQAIQNAASAGWSLSESDMAELAAILGDFNLDA